MPSEKLAVEWWHAGQHIRDFADLFEVRLEHGQMLGKWEVRVQYSTPLVRNDPQGLLQFGMQFENKQCK
jgi:hypothetical protein